MNRYQYQATDHLAWHDWLVLALFLAGSAASVIGIGWLVAWLIVRVLKG